MKPSIEREQRLFDALKRITSYSSPDDLRRTSEKKYGPEGDEAIEMAYENVLQEARNAIKGLRRPTGTDGVGAGAPGTTDAERAAWLADKIAALGDYAKEAAAMLRRWPAGVAACRDCGAAVSDGKAMCPRGGGRNCWVAQQPAGVGVLDHQSKPPSATDVSGKAEP